MNIFFSLTKKFDFFSRHKCLTEATSHCVKKGVKFYFETYEGHDHPVIARHHEDPSAFAEGLDSEIGIPLQ